MKWLHDPDKDEYFSKLDDELRRTEVRRLSFGRAVLLAVVTMVLLYSLVGYILWQEMTG